MSRTTQVLKSAAGGLAGWLARYFGWLSITAFFTLSGNLFLMIWKDWDLKTLFTSMMVWPLLGLALLLAIPIAFLPFGRMYLYSALTGAIFYNLILLIS